MYKIKVLQKVFASVEGDEHSGVGWLTKRLELPFAPFAGLQVSFPWHKESLLPSFSVSVEAGTVIWCCREQEFTVISIPVELLVRNASEFAEKNLIEYLDEQVNSAWDSSLYEQSVI